MKFYQYLVSAALTSTLMSGAMAATQNPAVVAGPMVAVSNAVAAPAPTGVAPNMKAAGGPMIKKQWHRKHKRVEHNIFANLDPVQKIQVIAEEAARFFEEHGFTNAVEAYENRENKFFHPDNNTYVVMYDSYSNPGMVLAHPDWHMRARNLGDIPVIQAATNACWSGQMSSMTYNWNGQNVIARAIPVAHGSYCVVARTVIA